MSDTFLLHANESGRLWSEDPDKWAEISQPEGCPICKPPPREWVLAETDLVWVTGQERAKLSGYVCVTSKLHAAEPYALSPGDQTTYWQDAMATAQGLADVLKSAKMNYEIHGNTVPHLHMHIYPRMPGDVYVGYPNHNRHTFTRSADDLGKMATGVRSRLREAGRLIESGAD